VLSCVADVSVTCAVAGWTACSCCRRRMAARSEYCVAGERIAALPSVSGSPREAGMDRDVLDVIEREIDDEVRARFPGGAVRQVVLLQYGDDPQIEPGDLWVRVLLEADGPEDYERSQKAFLDTHEAAIEQFPRYLAEKVREIINVEFTFSDNPVTRGGHDGPCWGLHLGERLSDYQEWERGEATFVQAPLGPAGLETLDTLILAGIAATRSEAIRWAMDRFRELPVYERLSERVRDAGRLEGEFSARDGSPREAGTGRGVLDAIEREIDDEVKTRIPSGAVSRVMLLQYGDDPEIEPGDLWVRVIPEADGPEDYERSLKAFWKTHQAAMEQLPSYLAEKLREIRLVEVTFNTPVTRDGHGPRYSLLVGQKLSDYQGREHGEAIFELARLGPAGLETLDTLIMAGIAATRGEAIRRALDRIRERPAYEQLREHVRDTGRLKDEFSAQDG
jgi:Arc/MetJ-type ribon-helix-helix transcriptional regulator